MLSRIPTAQFYGKCTVKGLELRFAGKPREKSYLDVKPNPNSVVFGILWSIPNQEIATLDLEEDIYHHFHFTLNTGVKVFSYTMNDSVVVKHPELEYLNKVLDGYLEYELPTQDVMLAYYKSLV